LSAPPAPRAAIEIVSATRLSQDDFVSRSALGLSLRRLGDKRLRVAVAFSNSRGLPDIYNTRITAPDGPDILVFIHDDVWIDDYFLADRVITALATYDVIGVAGNRRRGARQPAWAFIDDKFTWDERANLSGGIAHGKQPFGKVTRYGDTVSAECELLDGVFLAAKRAPLVERGVLFDPRFDFHFYDMDFCRAARKAGLRLGTWPICLTHQSGGAFGVGRWKEKFPEYLEKWPD
jgi:GT2 family glycosyltransferase